MSPSRLLIAAVALAAGCGGEGLDRLADGGRGRAVEALSGEVVRLQDGRTVRLAGVDAPTPEAEAALDALVAGQEVALLAGGGGVDVYGRPIAHLRLLRGRRWLQGALLDAGLVRVRTTAEDAALAQEMLRREARARARRRGLWSDPAHGVRLPKEVAGNARGFLIVEGRVQRTKRLADGVHLDFGSDRRGFSVQIPRRSLRDFAADGDGLEALRGRVVRVRGVVRPSRFGPTMLVDHPEQVEVLHAAS